VRSVLACLRPSTMHMMHLLPLLLLLLRYQVGAQYVILPKDLDYQPTSTTQILANIRAPSCCPLRVDFGGGKSKKFDLVWLRQSVQLFCQCHYIYSHCEGKVLQLPGVGLSVPTPLQHVKCFGSGAAPSPDTCCVVLHCCCCL
jgi:hypothetical protein